MIFKDAMLLDKIEINIQLDFVVLETNVNHQQV